MNDDQGRLLYKGLFVADAYNGLGTLYTPDQKVRYIGEFQNGQYGGTGKLFYPNGSIQYDGAFHAGKYSGAGKLFDTTGILLYEGDFAGNEYNGAGKLFNSKGIMLYDGAFKNGKFSGEGSEFHENGMLKYKGAFTAGSYNGEGVATSDKGLVTYKGGFINNVYHGVGEVMDEAGRTLYKGDFKNGMYDGVGTLFDADGSPVLKSFFVSGNVNLQGYIGLSSKKLEDILGKPAEVTLLGMPDPLAALNDATAGAVGGAGGTTGAGGTVVVGGANPSTTGPAGNTARTTLPGTGTDNTAGVNGITDGNATNGGTGAAVSDIIELKLGYPNYQMTFIVSASPANPKEATVTSFTLWGSKPLALIAPAVETFTDPKQPNALGYRILELKRADQPGSYTNSYYKDDYLLTFTHRVTGNTATQLEIIPTKPAN